MHVNQGIVPLLALPVELRRQIYSYLLPHTIALRGLRCEETAWVRGQINFLSTCRQIHEEGTSIMYGENTFVIDVAYDGITFRLRRLLLSGLVPQETPAFLDFFSMSCIEKMSKIVIRVAHVDSYTGMIKYNCGGPGLTDGLRLQVEDLVKVIAKARRLSYVQVSLLDWNKNVTMAQTVLQPFAALRNVEKPIAVTGAVTRVFAQKLNEAIMSWQENLTSDMPRPLAL